MALNVRCSACEIGDHDNHRRVVQAVPKGMMGGAVCYCTGECREKPGGFDFLKRMGLIPNVYT